MGKNTPTGRWSRPCALRMARGSVRFCYLGELNGTAYAHWQKIVEVFNDHGQSTQLKPFPSEEVETPLRTNLGANSTADLWKKYMQLTEVEATFRTLKSELATRSLFHQLERRVNAFVMVAFLVMPCW